MSLKFRLPRWCQLVCFRPPLIDNQNARQFICCLWGNQIRLCCGSLDWSALINSFLLQTGGAGRGLLIKERTSEMVNKLGPDSAGDAQSIQAARAVLAYRSLQVLLSVLLGCRKHTHKGGKLKSREKLWCRSSSFLYQPCVFLWWKVSRSASLGQKRIKFIREKQKTCLHSQLLSYLPRRPHSWPRVDPPWPVPTQLQVWPFLPLRSMAVWYCLSSLPLLPADNSEKYTQTAEELSGELLKRRCLWS